MGGVAFLGVGCSSEGREGVLVYSLVCFIPGDGGGRGKEVRNAYVYDENYEG